MRRLQLAALFVALAALSWPNGASGAAISLSLNLQLNTPGNLNSGGTWLVVVKADQRGVAGVSLDLTNDISFNPATGFLGPAGFEVQMSGPFPGRINILDADDPTLSRTLDVGVVGGPFPTTYADPPNLAIVSGNPNLGSFSGGVRLVTGTFSPGVVPSWFSNTTSGNIYTAPSGPGTIVAATVQTTVRYNVPEPSACIVMATACLVALVRRRSIV